MRFLGIDYGSKRIGLAISDENNQIAFPKGIILTHDHPLEHIGKILKEENITDVVIGESMDFAGQKNKISEDIESFISELKKNFSVVVHKQKEFLTSVEARKMGVTKINSQKSESHSKIKKERGGRVDAGAATLILQRFLERYNKQNK